jgi:anti-sigma factor RsiW
MTTPHPDGVTLNDYADNALAPAARADVDVHVVSCAECRSMVEAFRNVRSAARALTPIEAPPGSWRRIERELGAGRRAAWWPWLAAAAALVLATLVGFKVADLRRQPPPAQATASTDGPTAQSVEAELLQAEQHYQKAIAGLEQIANSEKGALDPQTASTLEKNLTVIDQAISESRAALKTQPSSEPAQVSLLENFKSKIALLQDTVTLINEMRRGAAGNDVAGAARAVTGLK